MRVADVMMVSGGVAPWWDGRVSCSAVEREGFVSQVDGVVQDAAALGQGVARAIVVIALSVI